MRTRGVLGIVVAMPRATNDPSRALVLCAMLLGCREGMREGNFEDEQGSEDSGEPPDLPKSECLPRSLELGGGGCEDGEKCRYVVDPQLGPLGRCVPQLGELAVGEPCTIVGESDECQAGAQCWSIDPDGGVGVCTSFCGTFLTCTGDDDVCIVAADGLLALCLDRCVPTDPEPCPPAFGCYDSPAGRWACDRDLSGEAGAHGSPCACSNCCDPGLVCAPAADVDDPACMVEGATGCCASVCELPDPEADPPEGPPTCPSELETCQPYVEDFVLIGYERVGVCRL